MTFLPIATLFLIIAILFWLTLVLIRARRKIKLNRERPASRRLEKAIEYLQKKGRITNEEYRKLNKVSDTTTVRDLDELEKLGLVKQVGKKGRNVYYVLIKDYPQVIHT